MNVRKLGFPTACALFVAYSLPVNGSPNPKRTLNEYSQVSIATQLSEVQRGTFDGRDYLSIHIRGLAVGPSSCRSNVLRMHTGIDTAVGRQKEIENIALTAMLSSEIVMIVIPLDIAQCVYGKPTFTDLYVLPINP